jgi:parallel beta-helix repeat protein
VFSFAGSWFIKNYQEFVMRFGKWKNSGIDVEELSPRAALSAAAGGIKKLNLTIAFLVLLGLPSLSGAATYYVSPNGNDANPGTSDAQAWKTIAKVNSFKFAAGDDVYFKCGGTWSGTALQPNVQGASDTNRTVIGAYYGAGTIGVSGNKPILSGNSRTFPAKGSYTGLINLSSKSNVTVENLHVVESGGIGIQFTDGSNNIIQNCYIASTYRHGIRVSGSATTYVIAYNEITDTGYSRFDSATWPSAIAAIGNNPSPSTKKHIIRNNYVYLNHGEGIDLLKGTEDIIVEYNTVVNNRSGSIYIDRSGKRNIIRFNLVYNYTSAPFGGSTGISLNDEGSSTYAGTEGTKIYGNLIANTTGGIALRTQHTDSILKDTEVYNNTLIDNTTGILITDGPYENSFVKNNIIWCTGERSSCTQASVPTSHSGLTFDRNLWSTKPADGAKGSNDLPYAAPQVNKTSGWKNVALGGLTGKEFALSLGSPAIGSGVKLGTPYNNLINPLAVDFQKNQVELVNQDAHGSWEIGAAVFVNSASINPPSQLQLAITP